jgi:site-specific recombinase XerC
MSANIDAYLVYLRDVRRMSPNTVESYARDLAALASFAAARARPPPDRSRSSARRRESDRTLERRQ